MSCSSCGLLEEPEKPELQLNVDVADEAGLAAFGNILFGEKASHTLTLVNSGKGEAVSVSAADLPEGFIFPGGAFPGEGGTCGEKLSANSECKIIVEAMPTGEAYTELSLEGVITVTAEGVDLEEKETFTATARLSATGYSCVETADDIAQTTASAQSTFEPNRSSDSTAQSFVPSVSTEFRSVTLRMQKRSDFDGNEPAFDKVTIRLTANCPNPNTQAAFPCAEEENILASRELTAAEVPLSTADESAKEVTLEFPEPVSLTADTLYWVVVTATNHTAGFIQVARNTVEADVYTGGEQLIGTFANSNYSRFENWDLYFKVARCETRE